MRAAPKESAQFQRLPLLAGVDLLKATYVTQRFSRHFHEDYALGCIESGAMRFRYLGAGMVAAAGQVNLVVPGEAHDGHAATEKGWAYRMFYLPPETVLEAARSLAPHAGPPHFRQGVLQDPLLAAQVRAAHLLLADPQASRLAKETRLLALLRSWISRHAEDAPAQRAQADAPQAVARAMDLIRARLTENLGLDELARAAGVSPFHLVRLFTAHLSIPPHAYLLQARLERARELLAQGDQPLAQVAAEAGFADQSHLTRRFKRHFGVTPGMLRKNVQDA